MHFAYVDESGDPGPSGSKTFTLGCLLLEDRAWLHALDELLEFRRGLRDRFGLPIRAEVKAHYLLSNSGEFRKLGLDARARYRIYRDHLRIANSLEIKAFAIVVHKAKFGSGDPRPLAWNRLMQRLERFTTKNGVMLSMYHDEGEGGLAREWYRKARRAGGAGSMFGTGMLKRPAQLLIEDPAPRRSSDSFFIQLADLVAYAAFRKLYPITRDPGATVVPEAMWGELGGATLAAVNAYSGGPPGIVQAP